MVYTMLYDVHKSKDRVEHTTQTKDHEHNDSNYKFFMWLNLSNSASPLASTIVQSLSIPNEVSL